MTLGPREYDNAHMQKLSRERSGELLILGELFAYSLFPIIIAYSTKIIPPIMFAGLSVLIASITLFLYLLATKKLSELRDPQTIKYSLAVALFIVIIPSILIFTGSSKTSGINTTILLQIEILFTFIFFGIFRIEKITARKIIGATIVIFGTTFILYNGNAGINTGDLLIIAGTLFYPIGNFFAKKALEISSPSTILFIRNILGGITLVCLSFIFEDNTETKNNILKYWPLILFNGLIIYHVSKVLWYEAIKRIDISKALTLSLGGAPSLSLIFAFFFLGEVPTPYQIIGFVAVLSGILILTRKITNAKK